MDFFNGIMSALGFSNLLYCFIGCILGTIVGVLPGLGPASTLAILLPLTMYLDPTGSIIMLAGLCYGAMYGGTTTSVLVNIPGEASSVVTCFDGFQMTRQGRAGQALWIAAVGSLIAGTAGVILIATIGPPIAKHTLAFGPPEYFGLLFFSLSIIISLSGTSPIRGLLTGLVGLFLAAVGIDAMTGTGRLHFGIVPLMRGFDIIPVVVGLFGIGEIIYSAGRGVTQIYEGKLGRMMPRGAELKKGLLASLRGTALGLPLGLLPGMLPSLTTFMAYDLEKRISRYPEKFGTGVIEGVAGPEAANNATIQAGFLPLMALGIPTGPAMAILLSVLMMHGLQPGLLFEQNKEFIWTVIGSMYIGNIMLLLLNLPLVGLWARISVVPYKILAPVILAICVIGAYSPRNTLFDVWVALAFGVIGFLMKKFQWPLAPLVMGFILGPMFEQALRQSWPMGGIKIFISRPIPAFFLVLTMIMTVVSLKYLRRGPRQLLEEEDL